MDLFGVRQGVEELGGACGVFRLGGFGIVRIFGGRGVFVAAEAAQRLDLPRPVGCVRRRVAAHRAEDPEQDTPTATDSNKNGTQFHTCAEYAYLVPETVREPRADRFRSLLVAGFAQGANMLRL